VAAGIAAAEPTLFQHGHVADTVLLGQVVGGGEPVAATADDDRVVAALRLGAAPGERPVFVTASRVAGERKDRVAHRSAIELDRDLRRPWARSSGQRSRYPRAHYRNHPHRVAMRIADIRDHLLEIGERVLARN